MENIMRIGILAVQGAFAEHAEKLKELGVESFEIRQKKDLEIPMNGLILPGGESTVMGKLIRELGMYEKIREMIQQGMPVLATCAGLILLADEIEGEKASHLATLPVRVKRNAYGRQLGSFQTWGEMTPVGKIPMTFIRAPYVESCKKGVEILARVRNNIVAVRYGKQIGLSFHPEITDSTKVHELFLAMC